MDAAARAGLMAESLPFVTGLLDGEIAAKSWLAGLAERAAAAPSDTEVRDGEAESEAM